MTKQRPPNSCLLRSYLLSTKYQKTTAAPIFSALNERLIGQLYAENAFLKKVYERLKQQAVEEKKGEGCYAR
ncbi:hypothetical protein COT48_00345 [Candidatus Woesearchaeota archaeon CG08_land_8_20_14_0_20_47_9]|nr:MAG: hypothetical protein COT48_00345 [Candidatus Woesearchaeota archaeon CG08_land_8_20_14_0_20_47_9]